MALADKKPHNKFATRLARGTGPSRKHAKQHRVDQHPRRGRGRPKGAQNYFTREVKEAILNAANRYGLDGKGTDGLEGYMLKLAGEEPKTFGMLIRAVMPTQVTVEHKEDPPPRNEQEVRKRLARFGLALEDLRPYRFHTPEQVLELTARDVTDDHRPPRADEEH